MQEPGKGIKIIIKWLLTILENTLIIFLIGNMMQISTFPFYMKKSNWICSIMKDQILFISNLIIVPKTTKISKFLLFLCQLITKELCLPFFHFWLQNIGFVKLSYFIYPWVIPMKK